MAGNDIGGVQGQSALAGEAAHPLDASLNALRSAPPGEDVRGALLAQLLDNSQLFEGLTPDLKALLRSSQNTAINEFLTSWAESIADQAKKAKTADERRRILQETSGMRDLVEGLGGRIGRSVAPQFAEFVGDVEQFLTERVEHELSDDHSDTSERTRGSHAVAALPGAGGALSPRTAAGASLRTGAKNFA
jgi:hypothetical protein